jgi:alpha-beta hydrolase superfamily lysophospholipase
VSDAGEKYGRGDGSVKPLWFGPEQRPLFGWLHTPADRRCRGGVLLASPLGIEGVSARYAYRHLAERLTESGFAVLRFDYDGTGDSAGRVDDPGRVAAWLESIWVAIGFIRTLGVPRLSVVGMRVGATLVAEAIGSSAAPIDDVVLWDPCASGRAFLREQRALWSIALGARANDDGSIETPGSIYAKETVADLSNVLIANAEGPLADGILLLSRSNRKGDRRMNEYLSMPHVERVSITGQDELVDVEPGAAKIPYETIEIMVGWLKTRAVAETKVVADIEQLGRSRAVVATTPDGLAIEERAMSLGPRGLFGILTSCGDETQSPTVFLLNAGPTDHAGPARLWVQLSRLWAAAGVRVVRFDLTGLGDSPFRAGESGPIIYAPDALDDVLDVLRAVSPEDPWNAILVGLCSGGYHAVEAALVRQVRGICAINPILTIKLAEIDTEGFPEESAEPLGARRPSFGARRGLARHALPAHEILSPLVQRLPSAAWWVINRIATPSPPARTLARVVDAEVDLLVVAGEEEAHRLSRGESRTMRRLRQNKRFQMEVIPELEHSLFERHGREQVGEMLTRFVVNHCVSAATRQSQRFDELEVTLS